MDRGLVTNPKDLERMQHELVSLARRIGELEDTELEVMERLEAAQAEHGRARPRGWPRSTTAAAALAAQPRRAGRRGHRSWPRPSTGERKVTAEGVPADLLALYEKLRAQKGGVGAAVAACAAVQRLQPRARPRPTSASIAKAPRDEVLRCEECNRILVRTAESGI